MDPKTRRAFDGLSCDIRFDESLAGYGTYRIGGVAAAVARPDSVDDVVAVTTRANELNIPVLAIGLGSNVLFDDQGYRGLVVRIATKMSAILRDGPDETRWTVGAGLPIPRLARETAKRGLGGVHRLIGVPGAVGGGVFMNAGAHGQDFANVVRFLSLVTVGGAVERHEARTIPWQYRSSGLAGLVVETEIELTPADPMQMRGELAECLTRRRAGTPFDQPCCGSVFRNPTAHTTSHLPEGGSWTAGRLIEAAKLKGYRIGGAEVSSVHANYVVNIGAATSEDVKRVIVHVQHVVDDQFGVRLVREVKFVSAVGHRERPEAE